MTLWHFPTLKLTFFSIPDTGVPLSVPVRHRGAGPIPWPSKLQGSQDEEVILYFIFHPRLMLKRRMSLDNFISNWLQGISSGVAKDGCYITTNPLTQLFRREIYNESISMGKWFQHFFANNSQYIMIFWTLQQRWGMLVVLGSHPVNIGNGYWWF